ncbi:MAG: hypothetical protein MN733_18100 [Nitrososphaera sp.]|nr:hypothetical protein [Nitrososphaera sp.]
MKQTRVCGCGQVFEKPSGLTLKRWAKRVNCPECANHKSYTDKTKAENMNPADVFVQSYLQGKILIR